MSNLTLLASKTTLRGCSVCGQRLGQLLHSQAFVLPQGHPLTQGYDVVSCESCGFVYADTLVSQADYDRFYATFSKYEDKQLSTGGDTVWDVQRFTEIAQQVAPFVSKSAKVLDIGCANGGLLARLQVLGYTNLYGIDPSPTCAANTHSLGFQSATATLATIPAAWGQFDCLILSHVLEHVQDLASAVRTLKQLLRPGGVLYLEVPDARRYVEFVTAPFQDFNTEHINHFSPRSLDNLVVPAGFEPRAKGIKTLVVSANTHYPAIFGIYTFDQVASNQQTKLEKDEDLSQTILAYIGASQLIMDRVEARIQQTLAHSPEVIVWGTGQLAMKLLAQTSLAKAKIAAFVDGNASNWGRVLNGSPIVGPTAVIGLNYPIIISSIIHQQAIADTIRDELGLPNEIVLLY